MNIKGMKVEFLERDVVSQLLKSEGVSTRDAEELAKISMRLRKWKQLEVGTDGGHIERQENTNMPFWVRDDGSAWVKVADMEAEAMKKLEGIIGKHKRLTAYIQGDPAGVVLYIIRESDIPKGRNIEEFYNRGIPVFRAEKSRGIAKKNQGVEA
jgi:hypothetical protein